MAENKVNPKELKRVLDHFKTRYNANTLPICESCGTNDQVIPCVVGKPSNDMLIYAQAGYAELKGCMRRPDMPNARCKKCNVYIHKPIEPPKPVVNKDI